MSVDLFIDQMRDLEPNIILVRLEKKYFGENIDGILFPDKGSIVLIMNLSNADEGQSYRIQPFDTTLKAIKELKAKLHSVQALLFHDDFRDFLYLSDLSFIDNYLRGDSDSDSNGRRSVRISKPSKVDIKGIAQGEKFVPEKNLLAGYYVSYERTLKILTPNIGNKTISSIIPVQTDNQRYSDYNPLNVVLFGPPGTGKTRASFIVASDLLTKKAPNLASVYLSVSDFPENLKITHGSNIYNTQFHPSYSYEDFFEGLRPVPTINANGTDVSYVVVPGVFKVISQLARAYLEGEKYGIDLTVQYTHLDGENGFSTKKWHIGEDSNVGIYKLQSRPGKIVYNGEIVQITGKILDTVIAVAEHGEPPVSGMYKVKWFYTGNDECKDFVLLVDELNRGNPAKIFGEALSLIEDTKRLGRVEKAEIVLPYSREEFCVPPNLHIVCAMNSSDRSLMNLDQAFRRRFNFVYLPPLFEVVLTEEFKKKTGSLFSEELLNSLKNHFEAVNNALRSSKIPQENLIGHSYLVKILRDSFSENQKIIKQNLPKVSAEELCRKYLMRVWETELHSQIREILTEHRIKLFCDNFSDEIKKYQKNKQFLMSGDDISKILYDYLEEIQADKNVFPWKKAA